MMTVFEWQADSIEEMAKTMAYAMEKTHEDKVSWKPETGPESKTRSALEQAAECIRVNQAMATYLSGGTPAPRDPNVTELPFKDCAEARALLKSTAKDLADVIRKLDDGALTHIHQTPFGAMPGAVLMRIALGNLAYHFGQISQIQLLYGDTEFYYQED